MFRRTTGPLDVVSLMQIASNVAHGGSDIRDKAKIASGVSCSER